MINQDVKNRISELDGIITNMLELFSQNEELKATLNYIEKLKEINAPIPAELKNRKESLPAEIRKLNESEETLSYLKEELMSLYNRIYVHSLASPNQNAQKVKQGNYSNRLQEIRGAKGISQMQLHRMTGIAQATISNIEAGKRNPNIKTKYKIAKALGVNVDEIFPK